MIKAVIINTLKQDRDKINALLTAQGDINVVACGKDGYDALKFVGSMKPDIAILDAHLEFIGGDEIPPLLRARSPSTAVVILTTRISDAQLYKAVSNEVSGLVCKESDINILPEILKSVHGGGCFISPLLAPRVLRLLSMNNPPVQKKGNRSGINRFSKEDPAGYLSKTELRILAMVGEGCTSVEIAASLGLSAGTVRNYISSMMRRMGLNNRSQMARYAFNYGLVLLRQSEPARIPSEEFKVLSRPEKKPTIEKL